MAKKERLPWAKWYPTDWLGDSNVQMAPLEIKGAWNEALQHMLHDGVAGLKLKVDGWARLWRCQSVTAWRILRAIKAHKIATVSGTRHGAVTVTCRRLEREVRVRQLDRLRQTKLRGRRPVTKKSR